jgi:hypothetical protein
VGIAAILRAANIEEPVRQPPDRTREAPDTVTANGSDRFPSWPAWLERRSAPRTSASATPTARADLDDRAGTMAALSLPDRTILVVANYLGVAVHTLS